MAQVVERRIGSAEVTGPTPVASFFKIAVRVCGPFFSFQRAKLHLKGFPDYIKVSGTDIRFEYDEEEKELALPLSKVSGKKIYMLPKINKPEGISTPDYLIDNEFYDLKRIHGSGKRTLKDVLKDKKKQSKRFSLRALFLNLFIKK